MTTYKIIDREAGNVIESGLSHDQALAKIKAFDAADKADGTFTPDFYEMVQIPNDIDKEVAVFHWRNQKLHYLGLGTIREMERRIADDVHIYDEETAAEIGVRADMFYDCNGEEIATVGEGSYEFDTNYDHLYCERVEELSRRELEAVERAGGIDLLY